MLFPLPPRFLFHRFALFFFLLLPLAKSVWRSKHPPSSAFSSSKCLSVTFPSSIIAFVFACFIPLWKNFVCAILPNALYFSRVSLSHSLLERFFLYIDRCAVRVGWHALEKTIIVTIPITILVFFFLPIVVSFVNPLLKGVFGVSLTRIRERHLHKRYERGLRTGRDRRIFGEL